MTPPCDRNVTQKENVRSKRGVVIMIIAIVCVREAVQVGFVTFLEVETQGRVTFEVSDNIESNLKMGLLWDMHEFSDHVDGV